MFEGRISRTVHQLACQVGEEKVVLQTKSGSYLGMNQVGAFIWDTLEESRSANELVQLVVARYDVDPKTAQVDVLHFIEQLLHEGLVEITDARV